MKPGLGAWSDLRTWLLALSVFLLGYGLMILSDVVASWFARRRLREEAQSRQNVLDAAAGKDALGRNTGRKDCCAYGRVGAPHYHELGSDWSPCGRIFLGER